MSSSKYKNNSRIRFSPNILKRLGEELNPHIDQSILELVKNSYDADASICLIEISGDEGSLKISIEDNGVGMSPEDIAESWLVFGDSKKSSKNKTKLGRTPVGKKGLGRLAALRSGERVEVKSTHKDTPDLESTITIDWSDFESVDTVDDVPLEIVSGENKNKKPGTRISIFDLRQPINRYDIRRLTRSLLMLTDPFERESKSPFSVRLNAPGYEDLEKVIDENYFAQADYLLSATIDQDGKSAAVVKDWKGDVIFEASHRDISGSEDPYLLPGVQFELWSFILNKKSFSVKPVTVSDVREWLSHFGGVHVYEDRVRVTPYGGPDDDWIGMNVSRVRSPEERPSTNTSIGRVVVSDVSDLLVQKTDRSGYVDNEYFRELRRFCADSLEWMARERLRVAEARRRKARKEEEEEIRELEGKIRQTLGKVDESTERAITKEVESYKKAQDKRVKVAEREVALYRALGTAGITAAIFAHESAGNSLKAISGAIGTVKRRSKKYIDNDLWNSEFSPSFIRFDGAFHGLESLSELTLKLIDSEKRRTGAVDVWRAIDGIFDAFEPFIQERKIRLSRNLKSGIRPWISGSVSGMESIVANLLNNAAQALVEMPVKSREILVSGDVDGETLVIVVVDSGKGIQGIGDRDIWLPGYTTRQNGTGLGLTIVKDIVFEFGGEISLLKNTSLGGLVSKCPFLFLE